MSSYRFPRIRSTEITPEEVWQNRRQWMKAAGATMATGALGGWSALASAAALAKLDAQRSSKYVLMEQVTPEKDATTYNNFFEFGTDKSDPVKYAHTLQTTPWKLRVEGECAAPKTFDIDDLRKLAPLEERLYRMRCVEGWSMAIPWNGYALSHLIQRVEPLGSAKYIEFISLADPKQMPGLRRPVLDWPYREGLRMDEAMNPLTLLTLGLYGEILPKQNGAPVRIVVPWKYGFKMIEVPIIFTDRTKGESKMSANIFKEAIFGVIQLKVNSLFKRYQANNGL